MSGTLYIIAICLGIALGGVATWLIMNSLSWIIGAFLVKLKRNPKQPEPEIGQVWVNDYYWEYVEDCHPDKKGTRLYNPFEPVRIEYHSWKVIDIREGWVRLERIIEHSYKSNIEDMEFDKLKVDYTINTLAYKY